MFSSIFTFIFGMLVGAIGTYLYISKDGSFKGLDFKVPFSFKIERTDQPYQQPTESQGTGLFQGSKNEVAAVPQQTSVDDATLQKVLGYIQQNVEVSALDLKEALGISETSAKMYLDELVAAGKVSIAGERAHQTFYKAF